MIRRRLIKVQKSKTFRYNPKPNLFKNFEVCRKIFHWQMRAENILGAIFVDSQALDIKGDPAALFKGLPPPAYKFFEERGRNFTIDSPHNNIFFPCLKFNFTKVHRETTSTERINLHLSSLSSCLQNKCLSPILRIGKVWSGFIQYQRCSANSAFKMNDCAFFFIFLGFQNSYPLNEFFFCKLCIF